jgi:hypothetical protein
MPVGRSSAWELDPTGSRSNRCIKIPINFGKDAWALIDTFPSTATMSADDGELELDSVFPVRLTPLAMFGMLKV